MCVPHPAGAGVGALGDIQLGGARDGDWVHQVGDDDMANPEVVFGHCVARPISSVIEGDDRHT